MLDAKVESHYAIYLHCLKKYRLQMQKYKVFLNNIKKSSIIFHYMVENHAQAGRHMFQGHFE